MNYLFMSSHNYTSYGATNCNLTPILPGVTRILCSYYVNTLSSRKVKKRKGSQQQDVGWFDTTFSKLKVREMYGRQYRELTCRSWV